MLRCSEAEDAPDRFVLLFGGGGLASVSAGHRQRIRPEQTSRGDAMLRFPRNNHIVELSDC